MKKTYFVRAHVFRKVFDKNLCSYFTDYIDAENQTEVKIILYKKYRKIGKIFIDQLQECLGN